MEHLIEKMKQMNIEWSSVLNNIKNRELVISHLAVMILTIKEAMNEIAAELIILDEEVHRNGKGEI